MFSAPEYSFTFLNKHIYIHTHTKFHSFRDFDTVVIVYLAQYFHCTYIVQVCLFT